jgi:hypothetical protein
MNFTAIFLAISVVMQLFLISADRHDDLYTASIESTELWYNPWPAPGDQTDHAEFRRGFVSPRTTAKPALPTASSLRSKARLHASNWHEPSVAAPGAASAGEENGQIAFCVKPLSPESKLSFAAALRIDSVHAAADGRGRSRRRWISGVFGVA